MIELNINELKTGMQLARNVYRPDGTILLRQGYALTEETLPRLREISYRFWIIEEGLEHIVPEELIEENILNEALIALRNNYLFFRKKHTQPTHLPTPPITINKLLGDLGQYTGMFQLDQLQKAARILILAFRNKKLPFLLHLNTDRTASDQQFQRIIDIASTSIVLGKIFQFSEEELHDLVLGVFLMDIGYWILPAELANPTRRLSFVEFSALKEHPTIGFEMIRASNQVSLVCAHIAYQHHERQDGGGFPRRLNGANISPIKQETRDKRQIHRYAEIASVAESFVDLYRSNTNTQRSPLEVIKLLLRGSGTHTNALILEALIPLIPLYAVGNRVDIIAAPIDTLIGGTAIISKTNLERQDRPEITLLTDYSGKWIEHLIIDLSLEREYCIQLSS